MKSLWRFTATCAVAFCLYFLLIEIPRQALVVERLPLLSSPADVNLRYEDFTITPQDVELQLAGWWMPAENPVAVLVFIHGGGSSRHSEYFDSLKFYRAMVAQGIAVVAIDLRNHGVSGSDATGLQFGRTEKYDALAAIDWARSKAPGLPLFAMGISMGGATVIHAAQHDANIDGLILLDALLDTADAFKRGGYAQSGLPPAFFAASAWSAATFYGLPKGAGEALEVAAGLEIPMLVMQDPDDPVTIARYSRQLSRRNPAVTYWLAPAVDPSDAAIAWKGYWGSHVSAYQIYPEETVGQIMAFIGDRIATLTR